MVEKIKIASDTFSGREELAHDSETDFATKANVCLLEPYVYTNWLVTFKQEESIWFLKDNNVC